LLKEILIYQKVIFLIIQG